MRKIFTNVLRWITLLEAPVLLEVPKMSNTPFKLKVDQPVCEHCERRARLYSGVREVFFWLTMIATIGSGFVLLWSVLW